MLLKIKELIFSVNVQCHINEKYSIEVVEVLEQMLDSKSEHAMQLYNAALWYSRDLTLLVSNLRDEWCDGVDCRISMKVESL